MMMLNNEISKAFNRQASTYEKVAVVQQEIGERLFERLHYLKVAPQTILDLGCGAGYFSAKLKALYPNAHIVSLDIAYNMLLESRKKQHACGDWSLVAGDMSILPFANGCFDLIFANQVIHWSKAIQQLFRELNRVMRPNGCLMFSTLGPYTFEEISMAWSQVNTYAHVNEFTDMHVLGDWLLAEYFAEPVVDMELLSVHYKTLRQLIAALKMQGVKNINPNRNKGLTSRSAWSQFESHYANLRTEAGEYPLNYEIIYGQAWKTEQRISDAGIETLIPVASIKSNK